MNRKHFFAITTLLAGTLYLGSCSYESSSSFSENSSEYSNEGSTISEPLSSSIASSSESPKSELDIASSSESQKSELDIALEEDVKAFNLAFGRDKVNNPSCFPERYSKLKIVPSSPGKWDYCEFSVDAYGESYRASISDFDEDLAVIDGSFLYTTPEANLYWSVEDGKILNKNTAQYRTYSDYSESFGAVISELNSELSIYSPNEVPKNTSFRTTSFIDLGDGIHNYTTEEGVFREERIYKDGIPLKMTYKSLVSDYYIYVDFLWGEEVLTKEKLDYIDSLFVAEEGRDNGVDSLSSSIPLFNEKFYEHCVDIPDNGNKSFTLEMVTDKTTFSGVHKITGQTYESGYMEHIGHYAVERLLIPRDGYKTLALQSSRFTVLKKNGEVFTWIQTGEDLSDVVKYERDDVSPEANLSRNKIENTYQLIRRAADPNFALSVLRDSQNECHYMKYISGISFISYSNEKEHITMSNNGTFLNYTKLIGKDIDACPFTQRGWIRLGNVINIKSPPGVFEY